MLNGLMSVTPDYWIRADFRHYCMEQFTLRKCRPFFCKRNSVVSCDFPMF